MLAIKFDAAGTPTGLFVTDCVLKCNLPKRWGGSFNGTGGPRRLSPLDDSSDRVKSRALQTVDQVACERILEAREWKSSLSAMSRRGACAEGIALDGPRAFDETELWKLKFLETCM